MERTISFPKIFNATTGKVNLESGVASINDCLYLLLNSMNTEMLGDPMYGSGLLELTFTYQGTLLEELIRSKICNAVRLYERRIEISEDDIQLIYDEDTVIIQMSYYVKAEGTTSTFSLAMQRTER